MALVIDRAVRPMAERNDPNRTPRSVLATLTIVLLGAAMTWFLVWTELRLQPLEVNCCSSANAVRARGFGPARSGS